MQGKESPGHYLRHLRRERGWTQYDLASEVGVTRATVGRWEINAYVPSLRLFFRLTRAFDISAEDLLGVFVADG